MINDSGFLGLPRLDGVKGVLGCVAMTKNRVFVEWYNDVFKVGRCEECLGV